MTWAGLGSVEEREEEVLRRDEEKLLTGNGGTSAEPRPSEPTASSLATSGFCVDIRPAKEPRRWDLRS